MSISNIIGAKFVAFTRFSWGKILKERLALCKKIDISQLWMMMTQAGWFVYVVTRLCFNDDLSLHWKVQCLLWNVHAGQVSTVHSCAFIQTCYQHIWFHKLSQIVWVTNADNKSYRYSWFFYKISRYMKFVCFWQQKLKNWIIQVCSTTL